MKLFISKLHYKKELNFYEEAAAVFLRFLSVFYSAAVSVRNFLYDKNILRAYSSKSFVISIGNLTAGGTGKTPAAIEAAQYYVNMNKKTAVLTRGYGGKLDNRKPHLISDGKGSLYSAEDAGDEPFLIAERAKGAYVVSCRNRIKAEKFIHEKINPDIIILDDGFQYRRLKRDIDIVLIDAKNKFGNKLLLPAGPLREKIENIKRADKVIVVNKNTESKNALKYCDYLKKKFNKDTYLCKIVPDYAYEILTGSVLEKGARIMAFSAIGQNKSFYRFLKNDYKLISVLEYEDHHKYDKEDVSKIIQYAQEENISCAVTTEKDAAKIARIINDIEMPVKFYALRLKVYIDIRDICGI